MARLRVAECRLFIQAVAEKAEEMGVPVSVAIVGPEGHLIALERMDEAGWITPETAWAKAYTMAAFRSMSPRFQDGLVTQHWLRERNPQLAVNAAVFTGGKVFISGGAAPVKLGRLPRRVSAYSVNWLTLRTPPPMSCTLRFILPASSPKTRSRATRPASPRASPDVSPGATPSSTRKPGPVSPVTRPSTVQVARVTRCNTARILSCPGGRAGCRWPRSAGRPR